MAMVKNVRQDSNAFHSELYSTSYDKPQWKRILWNVYKFICTCTTEKLYCTPEINTKLHINYTSTKKKERRDSLAAIEKSYLAHLV